MSEYTESINRYTAPYLQCAQYGIFIHDLRGQYQQGYRWSAQISILHELSGDISKACVTAFLENAYKASGIYFFKRVSDKPHQFRVSFMRGDQ